jgi:methylisocitrate lyase
VRTFERIGAAAIHIEDQADPKRCPALEGRRVIPVNRFVDKLEVAREARRDGEMLIIARCDADEVGFEELIERCNRYLEAGADMVMPMLMKIDGRRTDTLEAEEQMMWHRRLVAAIEGPVLGISIPPGETTESMREAGYAAMVLTLVSFRAAANAMLAALRAAIADGTAAPFLESQGGELATHAGMMDLLGISGYEEIERSHPFAPTA